MRAILPLLALLPTFAFAAEQSRTVGDFQSIRSEGVYELEVTVGQPTSFKIAGDAATFDRVEAKVVGGELQIRYQKRGGFHFFHTDKLHISVTTPSLVAFSGSGVGTNALHGIKGDSFTLDYDGVGEVTAEGALKQLTVHASGTGSVDLHTLKAADTKISLSGVGEASVYASDSLSASVSGIGSLAYYGHPAKVDKSVSGIGSVDAMN